MNAGSPARRQVLAVRHVAYEDLDALTPTLDARDFDATYLDVGFHSFDGVDPLAPELLVVLGGPIGVYDTDDYPYLADEVDFLRRRVDADLPTLGLCLGAQMMAAALGAAVYPGPAPEIGWFPIVAPTDALGPVRHLIGNDEAADRVLHWHGDTFDLPDGATLLASSAQYTNQAFSCGEHGIALQFHAEVTPRGLERWIIGHARQLRATEGLSIAGMRGDAATYGPGSAERSAAFLAEWLDARF